MFEFPFAIEGDKIGNHTIKLSMLNKDSKWTKALKLMLANLKVGVRVLAFRPLGVACGARREDLREATPKASRWLPQCINEYDTRCVVCIGRLTCKFLQTSVLTNASVSCACASFSACPPVSACVSSSNACRLPCSG